MPEVLKDFFQKFTIQDLQKIKRFRLASIIFNVFVLSLNIFVYISVTYIGFLYWGPEGYYYDYYLRLFYTNLCYYLTWIAIYCTSFVILLCIYSQKFTVKPFIEILKFQKNQNLEVLNKEIKNFKTLIRSQIIDLFFIIITLIVWLNYYPRNAQLFYPYITCEVESGICYITDEALFPYIMIMTSFLIVLVGLYLASFLVNLKEIRAIRARIGGSSQAKFKSELKAKKNEKKRTLTLEQRRQEKLNQLREKYQKKSEEKEGSITEKFDVMIEKEQYGKKGYKKLKKETKKKEKTPVKKVKKKDEFDFR